VLLARSTDSRQRLHIATARVAAADPEPRRRIPGQSATIGRRAENAERLEVPLRADDGDFVYYLEQRVENVSSRVAGRCVANRAHRLFDRFRTWSSPSPPSPSTGRSTTSKVVSDRRGDQFTVPSSSTTHKDAALICRGGCRRQARRLQAVPEKPSAADQVARRRRVSSELRVLRVVQPLIEMRCRIRSSSGTAPRSVRVEEFRANVQRCCSRPRVSGRAWTSPATRSAASSSTSSVCLRPVTDHGGRIDLSRRGGDALLTTSAARHPVLATGRGA